MFDVYRTSLNNSSRFVIGVSGDRPLHVVGLNPSTATNLKSDTTISKIKTFSSLNGYDGFMVYNLYPKRFTDPNRLPQRIDRNLLQKNVDIIHSCIRATPSRDIWLAWGQTISKRGYLLSCLVDLKNNIDSLEPKWIALGERTLGGHPRHPSRVSYKKSFNAFNLDGYINKLKGST